MASPNSNKKWSFGQDNRFPRVKKSIDKISYDIPHTRNRRSAGFGVGERFKVKRSEASNDRNR